MALPDSDYSLSTVLPSPDGAVSNPLLYVKLEKQPQEWWDDCNTTDGTKGRAARDSDGTELAVTWIEFDRINQTGKLRIHWPGLVLNGETKIRVYAPNTRNVSVAKTDPFGSDACMDGSNVLLYSPNGGNDDRSSNGFTLTENGGLVSGDSVGKNGAATSFSGTNQYLNTSISNRGPLGTMISWVKPDTSGSDRGILSLGNANPTEYIILYRNAAAEIVALLANTPFIGANSSPTLNGEWTHGASTVFHPTPITATVSVYVDGDLIDDDTDSFATDVYNRIEIGNIPNLSSYFDGQIQESFIFTDVKTTDWINFEYLQTNDNESFWDEWVFGSGESEFCQRAITRLIEQFEQKENIQKYLCALITPFDELQGVLVDLETQRNLDDAEGVQLDGIGDIVGLARGGLNDDNYRIQIRIKIIINASNGEVESVLGAMQVFAGGTFVEYLSLFPAGFILVSDGVVPLNIIQLLEQVAQAGIRLEVYATYGESSFRVAPDPGEPPSSGTRGFSEPNYAPDAGLGGSLVEKFS